VRWEHPVKGLISPKEFIPVAEDSGLIVPLGLWVLEEACCQTMAWQHAFPADRPVQVSVNLSPRQFEHPSLLEDVQRIVDRCGLGPGNLTLEVTEGMIMRDPAVSIRILSQLKDLGIRLAIDDFGTGYSSLSYLKTLPVDAIKIDRSFIEGIGQNEEDDAIVLAVIAMARSLELEVVAEGVEDRRQDALLRTWGCDRAQGYLYARPCPAAGITDILGKNRWSLVRNPGMANG
jgi:EAL domain-containing protein (putative c-di-GMP-specific phosphodiesterase class I)